MGQRLNAPQSGADLDAQALLKVIMPVVKEGLEEREGFVPLAALIALDGTIRRITDPMTTVVAEESTKQAMTLLRAALQQEVASGSARATALAADVRIWRKEDGDEASNAVSVHVEHQNGYCVDLLIPYKVRRGMMSRLRKKPQVMFRTMIAQESDPVIFDEAAATSKVKQTELGGW